MAGTNFMFLSVMFVLTKNGVKIFNGVSVTFALTKMAGKNADG
jgi:hypothetical protein